MLPTWSTTPALHAPPALPPLLPIDTTVTDGVAYCGAEEGSTLDAGRLEASSRPEDLVIPALDDQAQPSQQQSQRAACGILTKLDSTHASLHAMEIVVNLLHDTRSYIETMIAQKPGNDAAGAEELRAALVLPCDCLRAAEDGIDRHASIISLAVADSSDVREDRPARRKLMKSLIGDRAQRPCSLRAMEQAPESALTRSLNCARESMGLIMEVTAPDLIGPARVARKWNDAKRSSKKRKSSEECPTTSTSAPKDEPNKESSGEHVAEEKKCIEVIDLPDLMDGTTLYSPLETVAYIDNLILNNPGKSYIRAYKEKMIAEKVVPVRMTQLNSMVKQYRRGGQDKPLPPLNWNERGGRDAGLALLLSRFRDSQRRGRDWTVGDTREVLAAAAGGKEGVASSPSRETVETRHSELVLLRRRQNHASEQIRLQEARLRERPRAEAPRVRRHGPRAAGIKFDKNDSRYERINLPEPAGGNPSYTPAEAVSAVVRFVESDPAPSRTDIRLFKEKMIAEGVVPIGMTQLNGLIKRCGPPGKEPAPKRWGAKGCPEIISIEDLAKRVNDSQELWRIEDSFDALWAEKRERLSRREGANTEEVKQPDKKTVMAYHTALMSMPQVAHRVVKPEA